MRTISVRRQKHEDVTISITQKKGAAHPHGIRGNIGQKHHALAHVSLTDYYALPSEPYEAGPCS